MSLEAYKSFVDSMVALEKGTIAHWVREKGFPETPEKESRNALLAKLSSEDKEVLASIVEESRSSGIHDVFVFLNEQMSEDSLHILVDGESLPIEPFGTELFFDWVARCAGDEWPEADV